MHRNMLALSLAAALLFPAATPAAEDSRDAVISAATNFSIAYGVWLMEKRCNAMPPDKRKAYDAIIVDILARLQAAADSRIFNAAVGAGRDVSNDPKNADCKEFSTSGMPDFGYGLAVEAQAKLAALPEGYHLTITD